MNIVSKPECEQWLKSRSGVEVASIEATFSHNAKFAIPVDSGIKTAIARALVLLLEDSTGGLFWITGWGIFPSSENVNLFDGFRRSLSETRPIHAAPGHVFKAADIQHLELLLALALYFYWDAILIDDVGTFAVRVSHDEFISFYAQHAVGLQRLQSCLAAFRLQTLSKSS